MPALDSPSPIDLPRRKALLRLSWLWAAATTPLAGCGGGSESAPPPPLPPAPEPPAPEPEPPQQPPWVDTPAPPALPPPPPAPPGPPKTTVLNSTLKAPWGMVFLPDRRILVTQKNLASMVILSADTFTASDPLSGLPAISTGPQAGLMDVVLDPDYGVAGNNWIYFSYVESGNNAGVSVARARLSGLQLLERATLFRAPPVNATSANYGSRLAFRADKTLFITLGDRMMGTPSQDQTSPLGKVLRINRNGSTPSDNPVLLPGALPQIWTLGHRNPQGAAIHPTSGELWVTEHGPEGGDELNLAKAGRNFGWPVVSYGCEYTAVDITPACRIGGTQGVHAPAYTEPVSWWPSPSIAPAGLMFYTGDKFPEWRGNAFLGALRGTALWRVVLEDDAEVSRESVFGDMGARIRCVKQGPDGWIYLLTDEGKLLRVER